MILLLLAIAGCGPSAEAYPYLRDARAPERDSGIDAGQSDGGPPEVPPEPLEDWDTRGAGPLSGVWAIEVSIPARVVVEVESRQLYRARIVQRGRDLRTRLQACRIALPSIRGVADLSFSPGALRVIEQKILEDEGAFLSADPALGAVFAPPPITVVLGAALRDPIADPLPSAEMPERAIDEDEDGRPGVTLLAEAITCRDPEEAYIALRARVAMTGTITSLDAFEGDVAPELDQSVIGVSDRCLAAAAEVAIEIQPGARFRARRVGEAEDLDGNGNVSCPEIGWASARLFGDFWLSAR